MRIIAGKYRGRVLKSPPDSKTRPTSDRLRETLFNIIQNQISTDTSFLDLCAGTGAVGIEALSRGAAKSTFVDKSKRSIELINSNLEALQIPKDQTVLVNRDSQDYLKRTEECFDIVFYDPPYLEDYANVLAHFGSADLQALSSSGIFIAEHSSKKLLPDEIGELRRWRILKQGDSSLSFYERS